MEGPRGRPGALCTGSSLLYMHNNTSKYYQVWLFFVKHLPHWIVPTLFIFIMAGRVACCTCIIIQVNITKFSPFLFRRGPQRPSIFWKQSQTHYFLFCKQSQTYLLYFLFLKTKSTVFTPLNAPSLNASPLNSPLRGLIIE